MYNRASRALTLVFIILPLVTVQIQSVISLLTVDRFITSAGSISYLPAPSLHVEGKYVKNSYGQIVYLRGAWTPIFEDTCNARAALNGENWNVRNSVTTWRETACNNLLDIARQWGFNTIASFMWMDWWLLNPDDSPAGFGQGCRTELGYVRSAIVSDRPYRQNIREFCLLAQAKGIYIQLRPYGVVSGFGTVGEGRVNFPFPVSGESYTHDGSLIPDADAFAEFWYSVAYELADVPNVVFNLYDEPVISSSNRQVWFDAAAKATRRIRAAEAQAATDGRTSYTHLVQIHWGFCGPCTWIPNWLQYAQTNAVDLTNIIYSNHIYRDQGALGTGGEETYGPPPYPFDYTICKSILEYMPSDARILDYPAGTSREAYGRAYKAIVDTYNVTIIATFGANTGTTSDEEYQNFINVASILNEWEIGYWVYVWWRTGMVWSVVQTEAVPSSPNRVGQALIDAIAAGAI